MFPVWFQPEFFERNVPSHPLRVLQIGTYTGDATEWLLNNRDVEFIDDVDTWEGSDEDAHHFLNFNYVEEYYDSRFRHNPKVNKYKMTSDFFFWNIPKKSYNFILIDGDHTALQTAKDAINAFDVLEVSGIMAFDDYLWHASNPSVDINKTPVHGIEAALKIFGNRAEIIEKSYQLWVKRC